MILVFNIKKILIPAAAALLFVLIAGIILGIKDKSAARPAAEIYDAGPVLIIDAGHGGADGGAVAENGREEAGINLAIAQKLEAAAKLFGIKTLMTRTAGDLPYPQEAQSIREKKVWDQNSRLELINSCVDGLLISIHQNTYPDPRPSGPQVLYGGVSGSKELAELVQEAMNHNLDPDSRRLAAPASDSIYLMKSSEKPAILVECGFISNKNELELLSCNSYQCRIAAILLACYIQFRC